MALILVVLLSILFAVTHIGMAHGGVRQGLIDRLGLWPYRGLYSFVSFVTLGGAAVILWNNRHVGPVLWQLSWWAELAVALPLMWFALLLIVLSLANPSPAGMMPTSFEPRGVLRITRHPMNVGLALFGCAHLAANGALGDVAFFGSFFVVGLLGACHQDRRFAREASEKMQVFRAQTSVLPFAAVLRRKTKLELSELSLPLVIVATAVWAALAFFHGRFFGAGLL